MTEARNPAMRPILRVCTVAIALFLTGCRKLPDVRPFAESTAALHGSVATTQSVVVRDVRTIHDGSSESIDKAQRRADRFSKEWDTRVIAMKAMVEYADSLVAIVEAGHDGKKAADAVADSLNSMIGSVAEAFSVRKEIPGNIVGAVTKLYQIVAEIRATRALGKALNRADPAIQRIATILVEDYKDLRKVLMAMRQPQITSIKAPHADDLEFLKKLINSRNALRESVVGEDGKVDDAAYQNLQKIKSLVAQQDRWHKPMLEAIGKANARLDAELALVDQTIKGTKAWAAAHGRLERVVRDGGKLNVRFLAQTAVDIHEIYKELRAK